MRVEQQADSIVWWVHESLFNPESRVKADEPTSRWQRYEFDRGLYRGEVAAALAFAQERFRVSLYEVEALPFRARHDHFLKVRLDAPESLQIPGIFDRS